MNERKQRDWRRRREAVSSRRRPAILRRAAALLLCAALLTLPGCGGDGERPDAAMGRYVETVLEFPAEAGDYVTMTGDANGTLQGYFMQNGKMARYSTEDGEEWSKEALDWNLLENEYIKEIRLEADGGLVLTSHFDGRQEVQKLYRIVKDGSLNEITIDWPQREYEGETYNVSIEGIASLSDGAVLLFAGGMDNAFLVYDAQGKQSGTFGGRQVSAFAVQDGRIYASDSSAGAIVVYEQTGTEAARIPFEYTRERQTAMCAGEDGALYLQNRVGVFRLAAGGSLWEKMIDGELTSLSVPAYYFDHLTQGADGSFYLSCYDGTETMKLARYRYDETVALLPEHELVVYTLTENDSLRQAAGIFQRKRPDTKVNITVASEDSTATKQELIRSLNTTLLNGKGPDVLFLDDMPIDSYIEKGVLLDVRDVLSSAENKGALLENITGAYRTEDGGVYAVPTKAILPLLFTDAEFSGRLGSLQDAAAFAESRSGQPLVGDIGAQRLAELFLPASAPGFLKGSQLDEAKLADYLQTVKRIAATGAPSYPLQEEQDTEGATTEYARGFSRSSGTGSDAYTRNLADVFHYAYGRSDAFVKEISSLEGLTIPSIALEKRGGETAGRIVFLPGLADPGRANGGVFIPTAVVGINQNSGAKESAKDFLSVMLSEEVQSASLNDGLPVNKKVLEAKVQSYNSDAYIGSEGVWDESEELSGPMASVALKKEVAALYEKAEIPWVADGMLTAAILSGAEGYFDGSKTLEQAISDIREATKLYLSE